MSVTHVVTGAFGYTGKYIARRLLDAGHEVRTLTGHPGRPDPFGGRVGVSSLDFDNVQELRRALDGADTLFNTYWIRFAKGELTHQQAVRNIRALIQAAVEAGVRRIVHVSITNATRDSPLPYFRGKAEIEDAILQSGMSYAILRPTLIFGIEDILTNNIAWLLRRFPYTRFSIQGDTGCSRYSSTTWPGLPSSWESGTTTWRLMRWDRRCSRTKQWYVSSRPRQEPAQSLCT
ncbi:MAG: NAD(P)H-binding protein [SAR202 cluster bacterium]|jgi:NADH dehydrogenase|nr:NAD(P)H-binding protein [SAR202 cluster bacterium]|tara:strand:- start:1700 stop:2398 length:699 start_codon:yes stop_codon:yes gene_type:complete